MKRTVYLFIRCLEFVLHEYLGYLSMNYPKFKFYQGRWFTKLEWEAWERQELFRIKITQKHFPNIYAEQMKSVKFLLEAEPLITVEKYNAMTKN